MISGSTTRASSTGAQGPRKTALLLRHSCSSIPDHWDIGTNERTPYGRKIPADPGPTAHTFRSAMASIGVEPEQIAFSYRSFVQCETPFRFPRSISWSRLPLVETPIRLRDGFAMTDLRPNGAAVLGGTWPSLDAVPDDCRHLVVDMAGSDPDDMWELIGPYCAEILEGRLDLHVFDAGRAVLREVELDETRRIATAGRAADRLDWSCAVNFAVMVSRVFGRISERRGWGWDHRRRVMPRIGSSYWRSWSPIGIQMLHALANETRVSDPDGDASEYCRLALSRSQFAARDGKTFEWKGSGRYRPINLPLSASEDRFGGSVLGADRFVDTLIGLRLSGLVEAGRDGRLGLTDLGSEVVHGIGGVLDDPDSLLRWRDCETDPSPSMDRWMNKGFRSLKRRLSSMKSSEYVESDDGEDRRDLDRRGVYIHGVLVEVDEGSDGARIEEALRIHMADGRAGWVDRRLSGRRLAWLGTPLGVFEGSRSSGSFRWYTTYASNPSDVDPDLRELGFLTPIHPCGLYRVGLTSRDEAAEPILMPYFSPEQRAMGRRVFVGWVSTFTSEEMSGWSHKQMRALHQTSLGFPFPGMKANESLDVEGYGGSFDGDRTVVWSGVEIGFRPSDDGAIIPAACDELLVPEVEAILRRAVASAQWRAWPRIVPKDFGVWSHKIGKNPIPYEGNDIPEGIRMIRPMFSTSP